MFEILVVLIGFMTGVVITIAYVLSKYNRRYSS